MIPSTATFAGWAFLTWAALFHPHVYFPFFSRNENEKGRQWALIAGIAVGGASEYFWGTRLWQLLFLVAVAWRARALALTFAATPPLAFITPILGIILPYFSYDGRKFFCADAPLSEELIERRKASFARLEGTMGSGKRKDGLTERLRDWCADIRFTKTVSVFFPFQKYVSSRLDPSFILDVVDDKHIRDVDGTVLWDAECSFGVNVAGYEKYKSFLAEGFRAAADRSVCLGKVTEHVVRNAERICRIAHKEQCSFHMSGTEAIMGAVRLARYNTGRPLIVAFSGAYHGWYDGVMQLGTCRPTRDLLVLKFGTEASLRAICARGAEIAAVLVNPLCALHANKPPPADFSLMSNNRGSAPDPDPQAYGAWLRKLTATCRAQGIVSIFDEVYVGFRYALGGAQEFFNVQADIVCYGKTLGGGLPCGVICGSKKYMSRSNGSSPASKAIVIGTFSSHPCVMATMDQFLTWTESPSTPAMYESLNERVGEWIQRANDAMATSKFPVHLVRVGSIWSIRYTKPGRCVFSFLFYFLALFLLFFFQLPLDVPAFPSRRRPQVGINWHRADEL